MANFTVSVISFILIILDMAQATVTLMYIWAELARAREDIRLIMATPGGPDGPNFDLVCLPVNNYVKHNSDVITASIVLIVARILV